MKEIHGVSADAAARALSAGGLTNEFYDMECRSLLCQIQSAVNGMGGDGGSVLLVQEFADLACRVREEHRPGLARVQYEEEVWRRYRKEARDICDRYLAGVQVLKEEPTTADYDPELDGENASVAEDYSTIYPLHFPAEEFCAWADLPPQSRTQHRMQFAASRELITFLRTVNWFPRLLLRTARHLGLRPNKSALQAAVLLPPEEMVPVLQKMMLRADQASEMYSLYKAAQNAGRHVRLRLRPYLIDGGRRGIESLRGVKAAKEAWAEYWSLSVPAIPLFHSRKASRECGCEACLIAQQDTVPALAGWLRSNTASVVSSQILNALTRETTDPRTEYFYDMMGEMEAKLCDRQACYCRIPETRNEAVAALRNKHVRQVRATSLDASPHEIRDPAFAPEETVIAKEMVEEFLREARTALAPREYQIFELLLDGMTYKQIAEKLSITVGSVGATKDRIKKKLVKVLHL